MESVVQACNIALSTSSKASFCSDFKKLKINGEVQYLNCKDDRLTSSLQGDLECGVDDVGKFCTSMKTKITDKIIINGISYNKDCAKI